MLVDGDTSYLLSSYFCRLLFASATLCFLVQVVALLGRLFYGPIVLVLSPNYMDVALTVVLAVYIRPPLLCVRCLECLTLFGSACSCLLYFFCRTKLSVLICLNCAPYKLTSRCCANDEKKCKKKSEVQ